MIKKKRLFIEEFKNKYEKYLQGDAQASVEEIFIISKELDQLIDTYLCEEASTNAKQI